MGRFNEAFLCLAIEHWIWILRVWGFLMIRPSLLSSPRLFYPVESETEVHGDSTQGGLQ
jgi:hypothetical protein